jgi:hypothetical protein
LRRILRVTLTDPNPTDHIAFGIDTGEGCTEQENLRAPAMQSWGLRVGYVHDPSGVLWHVAQRRENVPAG